MGGEHRPVIFVAGPISDHGKLSQQQQKENVEYAARIGLRLLVLGFAPIIPHLSWYCDPTTLFSEWYAADEALVARSDAVLRLPGKSWGAENEVALAARLGIPVLHSVTEVIQWHEAANGSISSSSR